MTQESKRSPVDVADEKYKPGQVWSYKTRAGEVDSTATVCRVDSFGMGDVTIHVFFDGIQILSASGKAYTEVTHAPISKEAMDRSVTQLIRDGVPLPDYEGAYKVWLNEDGAGVFCITLAEILDVLEITVNADSAGES